MIIKIVIIILKIEGHNLATHCNNLVDPDKIKPPWLHVAKRSVTEGNIKSQVLEANSKASVRLALTTCITGDSTQGAYNILRPRQNGGHFPDDNLKCIFLNENV